MTHPRLTIGWTIALFGAVGLLALAVAAPVVGGDAGHVIQYAFGGICHQLPNRSMHIAGDQVALCHRCTGIVLGLVVGLAGAGLRTSHLSFFRSGRQGRLLVLFVLPTAIDWTLGATGVWANTPASRILTGALFGLVAGLILAANLLAPPSRALSPSSLSHA